MKLIPAVTRRTYIIGGTMLVLLTIFGFYFLVFLPKKERNIIAQRVRALHRIEENFQEKYKVYQKIAKEDTKTDVKDYQKKIDTINDRIEFTKAKLEKITEGRGTFEEMLKQQDKLYAEIQEHEKDIGEKIRNMEKSAAEQYENLPSNLSIYKADSTYDDPLIWVNRAVVTEFTPFFEPLKLKDSFDGYIVYRDSVMVYQEVPGEVLRVPARLYMELNHEDPADQRFVRQNLEARKPEKYETPRVYEAGTDVQLAGTDYKLFCTHFVINNKEKDVEWTVYGLVTEERFEAEKKKIPFFGTVYLFAGLLLLLFSMPMLKLAFMSSIERLHRQDILFTSPSFLFCTAIVTIVLLLTSNYYLYEIPAVDKKLKQLAMAIESEFQQELNSINSLTLKNFNPTPIYPDSNSISLPRLSKNQSLPKPFSQDISYPSFRSVFWLDKDGKRLFEYATIRKKHDKKTPSYKDRKYFSEISKGKGFFLDGNPDSLFFLESIVSYTTGEPISVFSRPSSKTISVNKENKEAKVIALSTILQSITEVVLPPGYSFTIIDQAGEVLYHIDQQKNLQENYLEEIGNDSRTLAAMTSQSTAFSDVDYYHHDYRARIQPMESVPWYLVTTYDKAYIQSPYQNILTFCLLGIILLATVASLQVWLISLVYGQRTNTKLKKKSFSFDWIWPYQEERLSQSSDAQKLPRSAKYALVTVLNAVYFFLLLIFNQQSDLQFPQTIATFLYAIVFSYTTAFALFKEERDHRYWRILLGSIVVTLLALLVTIDLTTGFSDTKLTPFILVIIILIVSSCFFLFDISTITNRVHINMILLIYFVVIACVFLIYFMQEDEAYLPVSIAHWLLLYISAFAILLFSELVPKLASFESEGKSFQDTEERKIEPVEANIFLFVSKKIKKWWSKLNYSENIPKDSYYFMICSYIVLGGCLSVWFLCQKAYEEEMLVWKKYDLYQVSEELRERDEWLKNYFHESGSDNEAYLSFNDSTKRYSQAKNKASYFTDLGIDTVTATSSQASHPSNAFDSLIYQLRPLTNELTAQTSGFVFNSGEGSRWYAQLDTTTSTSEAKTVTDTLKVSVKSHSYAEPDDFFVLRARVPEFGLWSVLLEKHPLLLLVATALLFALYYLLRFTLIRLFGIGVFEFPEIIQIDDQQMAQQRKRGKDAKGIPYHQFFISMPFAGSSKLLNSGQNEENKNRIDLSYALNDDEFQTTLKNANAYWKKEEEVMLEHFSYGIDDPDANIRRLQLLETLLANRNAVTIISKLTPMQITTKYEEVIADTNDQAKRDELENRVSRWKDILASFVKLYYSELTCNRNQKRLSPNCTVQELIHFEMSANRGYFERLDGIIVEEWGENPEPNDIKLSQLLLGKATSKDEDIKEEIILKIQSMAQPFYLSLWNTCSKEEKYILYDLADDGFVNTKDKQVLLRLMEKGLIFYDESFHIMNESFRNFILTNIKPAESLAMEKDMNRQGRWSTYSTIILLFVVSLVIFMVFAQDSVVNQFTALLAGLAAIVPYIIRLGGALVPNFARNRE